VSSRCGEGAADFSKNTTSSDATFSVTLPGQDHMPPSEIAAALGFSVVQLLV
jgi:hypothetical protein